VHRIAEGLHHGPSHAAVVVRGNLRGGDGLGAELEAPLERTRGVVDGERDVADAVAVNARVLRDEAAGPELVREDEPYVPLLDGEGLAVAQPGLEARLRQRPEAEGVREEVRRRERVADVELDVIDSAKHGDLQSAP